MVWVPCAKVKIQGSQIPLYAPDTPCIFKDIFVLIAPVPAAKTPQRYTKTTFYGSLGPT